MSHFDHEGNVNKIEIACNIDKLLESLAKLTVAISQLIDEFINSRISIRRHRSHSHHNHEGK